MQRIDKMAIGLVGRKAGVTRIFTDEGNAIPVTVIEVLAHHVTQVKTPDKDGYWALQVTTGMRKRSHVNRAETGHFAKAGVEPGRSLHEFRVDNEAGLNGLTVGGELKLDIFTIGQFVDVTGVTKGKGYAGVIKRHHFSSQDATHGNSLSHRAPGSIGQRQSPGKVFKGKKMAGHLGNVQRTILSQEVVLIDLERNLIMVRGVVPGAQSGFVVIRPAVKKSA